MKSPPNVLLVQADAFTDKPFAGNPAAVCLLAKPAGKRWMLNVTREMNLSETAFLNKERSGYRLRWFTPTAEVDLCGHATLASAHVLWEEGLLKPAAPAVGVNEDPVTGSAHCMLAPFWGERLEKTDMMARQLSHRGGVVRARLNGDRVVLCGQAVTTLKGRLR